jgi:DNA (cytosine-5)-methyltransferase 1
MNDLGYGVEWRVINAADYGFAQRRRRVFIFAFHKSTKFYRDLSKQSHNTILEESGLFSRSFKVTGSIKSSSLSISKIEFSDLVDVSDHFKFDFYNSGIALKHKITTSNLTPLTIKPTPLSKIVLKQPVDSKYYLDKDLVKFEYLKGSKKIPRSKNGNDYVYSEGAIPFPDPLTKPARTMLTSEGTTNRSTHIIEDPVNGKYRKLTPIEAERLNGFPDNWTNTGMNDSRRYFMMGNALVTGIVSSIGKSISQIISIEKN